MAPNWIKAGAGVIGVLALTALPAGPSGASSPPIDIDTLAPDAGEELDDAAVEELLASLEGVSGDEGGSSSLTGPCGGVAFSYDSDGNLIDAAYDAGNDGPPVDLLDGGQAFTSGNPYQVDTNGSVSYFGFAPRSGEGPEDYTYSLQVADITVASGDESNSARENRNAGTIDLSSEVPISFDAKLKAGGTMKIGGSNFCAGSGHVEFSGDGLISIPGAVGVSLLAAGLAGVFINARPARTWKG